MIYKIKNQLFTYLNISLIFLVFYCQRPRNTNKALHFHSIQFKAYTQIYTEQTIKYDLICYTIVHLGGIKGMRRGF